MKQLKYLSYVIRHKWFVFVECCKMGIPWRGLMHDMSKFRPSEFIPYYKFHTRDKDVRDKTGYYKASDTGDKDFDFAWFLHQKRNQHHWQWWVLPTDHGEITVFPMSDVCRKEMVCDWIGASRAQGHGRSIRHWYYKNKDKMILHPETWKWVDKFVEKMK